MNYEITEFEIPSSDGKHTLAGEIYKPKDGNIRAIVQLSHGMSDYVGRYSALADYLCQRGFALGGHAHLGHGKTARNPEELGFFADKDGAEFLVEDMHRVNGAIRERFGNFPVAVMGHSMGSFIARIYAERYPCEVSALIIHATGGPGKVAAAGKALVGAMSLIRGKKHRSAFVRSVASRGYNSKFPKEEGRNAWLSRDTALASQKLLDPYANFTFTLSGYKDLFTLVQSSNSKSWFDSYPKNLPTLLVSGDMDPVGNFGKGVERVYTELLKRGHTAISLKIYKGARHELFNEINREELFSDIYDFLGGVIL